jgi:signal transduction histidine kinase
MMSLVYSPPSLEVQHGGDPIAILTIFSGMLLAIGLPMMLFWRHRIPFITALAPAAASVVLPIGNSLVLIALAALIGRRRGSAVWWTIAAASATTAWVTVSDWHAQPRGASFWKEWLGPQPIDHTQAFDLPPTWVAIIIVAQLGIAIGTGLVVRARREANSAKAAVVVQQDTSARLGDEAARRQERERIAREVHDAMGYRLSLLNLHAGALEANAGDNPRLAQSAHLVRESANATMEDLRSLLDVLREPGGTELKPVALADLSQVIQESFGSGQLLSSSVFIQDADKADPALARAVYRIVQELLTNARKHAPGAPVHLSVSGGPGSAIVIDVRNPYLGSVMGPPGTSRGLTGIAERADLLGGTVSYGLDGGSFRVHVELPWR